MLWSDTINVPECYLHLLLAWDNNVCYSGHMLSLPLLVFGFLFVDDVEATFAADQNVIGADFFDACADFHQSLP